MPPAPPITRQTAGRTFLVAISILGVGAVVQFGAICWTFVARYRSAEPTLAETGMALESTDVDAEARLAPTPVTPDFGADPLAKGPAIAPGGSVLPKPTPIAIHTPKLLDPSTTERFGELMEQGKMLRERGDTGSALTKFREAQVLESRNPRAFAEIAMTYEKMGLTDRANEQWRRVYDLGETAGVLYAAAEAKLKTAQASEVSRVMQQAPSTPDDPAPHGTVRGAPVTLAAITLDDSREPGASKKFTLHVPIKARFGSRIDANDLVIQVHFYDVVDSARVERTGANVSYRWAAPPPDWAEGDTEDLLAQYELPIEKRNRKYFGYVVRLYYKGELQSAAGTPETLVQKYPPPQTLQNENTP